MGIKDNFQQALRELTGTDKEEKQQRDNKSIDAMKNAVAAGDTSEFEAIKGVPADTSSYDEIERRAAAAADEYNRQQSAFTDGAYQQPASPAVQQPAAPVQPAYNAVPQTDAPTETTYQQPSQTVQDANAGAYTQPSQTAAPQPAADYQQQEAATQTSSDFQQQTAAPQPNAGFQQQAAPEPAAQAPFMRPGDPGFGTGYSAPKTDPAAEQHAIFTAARYQHPQNDDDEITVISKNTVIDGNVRSFANMSVDGNVKGNIETTKDIDINGKVVGNIACNNAQMRVSQIQGNIQMKGNAYMERDTLLIGDLTSTYANVNGKIKGNLDITGKAELKSDAVVFGDISASTITVNDGAIIQGYVSTTFLNKEESKNIFPETITIGD